MNVAGLMQDLFCTLKQVLRPRKEMWKSSTSSCELLVAKLISSDAVTLHGYQTPPKLHTVRSQDAVRVLSVSKCDARNEIQQIVLWDSAAANNLGEVHTPGVCSVTLTEERSGDEAAGMCVDGLVFD